MSLKKARSMYLSNIDLTSISEELDMPISELRSAAFGHDETGLDPSCWYKQLQENKKTSLTQYTQIKSVILESIEADAIMGLSKHIKNLDTFFQEMSMTELKQYTDIVEKIQRMNRLEAGESTSIEEIKTDGMQWKDIRKETLASNPLFSQDIEEADYKEKEDD